MDHYRIDKKAAVVLTWIVVGLLLLFIEVNVDPVITYGDSLSLLFEPQMLASETLHSAFSSMDVLARAVTGLWLVAGIVIFRWNNGSA